MDSKNTNFRNALRTVIAALNTSGRDALRADEVRAYGWPRSDEGVWSRSVLTAGYRLETRAGEDWLVVS